MYVSCELSARHDKGAMYSISSSSLNTCLCSRLCAGPGETAVSTQQAQALVEFPIVWGEMQDNSKLGFYLFFLLLLFHGLSAMTGKQTRNKRLRERLGGDPPAPQTSAFQLERVSLHCV